MIFATYKKRDEFPIWIALALAKQMCGRYVYV